MFLSSLSYEQRKQFLGMAIEILAVDGGIDAEEESYLRGLCGEMSLSRNDAVASSKDGTAQLFKEREARQIVILELMGLALCQPWIPPQGTGLY